ncbi:MAG: hypothetical protein A2Y64_01920 [Candidatus Coatesbacteria bacterium RBG_13_66_14]|uniref:Uncharacterized protein n=1 Tax=Candidatus Coatesbacteria bacterium RBG_13_66_14 TaxID=1817816 RepID=A0A1F5F4B5_9BACT|nr:MAG: hypothetical protein A2Y64_01920 [Candidatus Coatesbacteria bacterium RBG_13_66_14]
MRDITYAASLVAENPLDGERHFAALTALRAWLDSGEAPYRGYRRLYTLFTHRGAAGFRDHPDLLVRLRRRLYPLYAWLRVELGADLKAVQLRTGMASHTGADAGWGAILWAAIGRAFIYIIPAWLALYVLKPWEISLALGIACFIVAGLGFIFFEYTMIKAALVARGIAFRAELALLHDGAVSRVAAELGLELLASRQVTGPGIEMKPPSRSAVTEAGENGEFLPPTG